MSTEVLNSHDTRRRLRKREILRGRRQFNRVMTEGKSLLGDHLRCFVSPSASGEDYSGDAVKVGFTVSRRIRKSTVRNRVKRIMREVYRAHKERLHQLAMRKSFQLELVLIFRGNTDIDPKRVSYKLIEKDFLRIIDLIEHAVDGVKFT